MRRHDSRHLLTKAAIFLLLVSVAGLSILARHSQYLPESSPIHFFSSSTKVDVDHLPVLFFPATYLVATLVPDEASGQEPPRTAFQNIGLPQIGVTLSLQHRSPPPSLA